MESNRFEEIISHYSKLRVAVVGDYSCDRYLEIDPSKEEISIETNLPVYNVTKVRAQPGASGTVLNNLAALGVTELWPVGFCGSDGEGFELQQALGNLPGVQMDYFFESEEQRTFTYCKPLVMEEGSPPRELNRLDSKNWHPTPQPLQEQLAGAVGDLARKVDAIIVLDQVDEPETGVVTRNLLQAINDIRDQTLIIGDSRRGLKTWPDIIYKMNVTELIQLTGKPATKAKEASSQLAKETGQPVFVSLAHDGIIGADPSGEIEHRPALPLRGEIDIVGAGDTVMANLTTALSCGAQIGEALELANAAASVAIHKLGTTGTASTSEIQAKLD
ncbi:MAG: PfkB family carbohydrate kinase [Verrucomicrobiota bacterium]|nr:PfkB family carbohydrate kinase [Verrucomicrobiota bacterium]